MIRTVVICIRRSGRRRRYTAAAGLAAIPLALAAAGLRAQAPGWERSVQLSANAWYGAAQARVVATDFGLSRTDSALAVRSDLHFGYADDRGSDEARRVTARAVRASLGLDYQPFARYSPFGFAGVESSLQQRIAQRYNVGVGAKLTLRRKDRDDLSVSLALLEERTRALASADGVGGVVTNRTRWSLRFRYRRQLTPTVYVSHVTFYQPAVREAADRYTVNATTALEVALTRLLSLTATHRHLYDTEAGTRGAASSTDGQLLVGLRARF
jgi:hypothetical protein